MRRALVRQVAGGAWSGGGRPALAVAARCAAQTAKPPPQPLTEEQLSQLVLSKKEWTDSESATRLELDEIHAVAEPVVKCLSEQVALSATEMLVRRAEANDEVGLTLEQLVAFGGVIRAQFLATSGHVDEAVLFDALWATFAAGPHGRITAQEAVAFCKIVWFGAVPDAVNSELASGATGSYSKAEFSAKLQALGVPKPSCKAREATMRQKTNWAKMVVQVLAFLAIMQASKYGLIDKAMQNSPLQRD